MLTGNVQLHLGVIICKHCGSTIDTLDTEKVIIYYGKCSSEACTAQRNREGENLNNEH